MESGVEKVLPGFSPLLSYELELSAEDLPGSRRTVVCAIPTAAAAVHLASGGTAVGVGKYAEHDRAVEVNPEWEVYVKGKPLWELIYPVGSLYLSAVDTDPGVLFGGTWERIRDRFLLAAGTAYGAGTTGGEAAHALTENELPAHAHDPANEAGYYGFITNSQKAFTVGIWAFRAAAVGTIPMPRRPLISAAIPKRAAWAAGRPTTICRRIWRCTSGNGRHEKEEERWHPIILPSTTAPTERR